MSQCAGVRLRGSDPGQFVSHTDRLSLTQGVEASQEEQTGAVTSLYVCVCVCKMCVMKGEMHPILSAIARYKTACMQRHKVSLHNSVL